MTIDIQDEINEILSEYIDTEREKISQIAEEVADETAKQLRKTSPKGDSRGKHYANGWKVKTEKLTGEMAITAIVYNATKPQLTHLLSKEHDIKNQFGGPYGRSTPDPHIDDAEQFGVELFLKKLRSEL